MLIFENKIQERKDDFISKLNGISKTLDIDPNWLMAVMNIESRLNPQAINNTSGAVGLIQWLPSTLTDYDMTPAQMRQFDNVQQLTYVQRYLEPYRNKMTKYADVYLAIFYPAALGKGDDYRFPNSVYLSNQYVDLVPEHGELTVADIKKWVMKDIPNSWLPVFEKSQSPVKKYLMRNWIVIAILLLIIISTTIYLLT